MPAHYPPNRPLGNWVSYARSQKKAGKLAKEWIASLDELGFCWALGRGGMRRSRLGRDGGGVDGLQERRGHCNVPWNWPEDPRLGRWIANLRRKKRQGRLDRRQIAQLNRLGFVWEPAPKLPWPEMYAALVAYKRAHGDCNVPHDWPGNPYLGPWIRRQRHVRKVNRLDRRRVEQLDALGFVWDFLDHQWESQYAALAEFRKQYGHCRVSTLSRPTPRWATGSARCG